MSSSAPAPMSEPNHARRFTILWVVATIIALPIVDPRDRARCSAAPNGSVAGRDQGTTMTVMAAIATPVLLLVGLFLIYASIYFRQQPGARSSKARRYEATPASRPPGSSSPR